MSNLTLETFVIDKSVSHLRRCEVCHVMLTPDALHSTAFFWYDEDSHPKKHYFCGWECFSVGYWQYQDFWKWKYQNSQKYLKSDSVKGSLKNQIHMLNGDFIAKGLNGSTNARAHSLLSLLSLFCTMAEWDKTLNKQTK